jgi:type VI protein secretion system component VasK
LSAGGGTCGLRPGVCQSTILTESPAAIVLAHHNTPLWRALLGPWLLALAMSAAMVAAGRYWPTPLLQQAWAQANPGLPALLALLLVLLPPALMAALLLARMRRHHDRGESIDCAHGER